MDLATQAAFNRLLALAAGDTGQARLVANFILAWWCAEEHGGFDLTDMWNVDAEIAADMLVVLQFLATPSGRMYPDIPKPVITEIIRRWRPAVWAKLDEAG